MAKAAGVDKQAIVDALKTLNVTTIVGKVDFNSGPVPNVAKTPLAGGQWRQVMGGKYPYDLVLTSNTLDPTIPVTDKVQPLS